MSDLIKDNPEPYQLSLTNEVVEHDLNIIIQLLDHTKKYIDIGTKVVENIFKYYNGVTINPAKRDELTKTQLSYIVWKAGEKLNDFIEIYDKRMTQIFKYLQNIRYNLYMNQ